MSIGVTRVEEVMITNIITVDEQESMQKLAKLFDQHDINAAPVVDGRGRCVGIISNHDIVEYDSARDDMMKTFTRNADDKAKVIADRDWFRFPGIHYDEVGFHMSTTLQTATISDPLSRVARKMCRQHIHHVIVLDDDQHVIGMLSALDVLGFIIDEPVCRTAVCPVDLD